MRQSDARDSESALRPTWPGQGTVYSFLIRHARRREPNSSPRHEGACPPSTQGGGGSCIKQQVCVSCLSRAGDGFPSGDVVELEG